MRAHMKAALSHINTYGIALSIFVEELQRLGHWRRGLGVQFPKQHTMTNLPSLHIFAHLFFVSWWLEHLYACSHDGGTISHQYIRNCLEHICGRAATDWSLWPWVKDPVSKAAHNAKLTFVDFCRVSVSGACTVVGNTNHYKSQCANATSS